MWSLGVVLYIMITGYMPYDEREVPKMLGKQLDHRIGYPESIKTPISDDVKLLIEGLLNPSIPKRYGYSQVRETQWLLNTPWLINAEGRMLKLTEGPTSSGPQIARSVDSTGSYYGRSRRLA